MAATLEISDQVFLRANESEYDSVSPPPTPFPSILRLVFFSALIAVPWSKDRGEKKERSIHGEKRGSSEISLTSPVRSRCTQGNVR